MQPWLPYTAARQQARCEASTCVFRSLTRSYSWEAACTAASRPATSFFRPSAFRPLLLSPPAVCIPTTCLGLTVSQHMCVPQPESIPHGCCTCTCQSKLSICQLPASLQLPCPAHVFSQLLCGQTWQAIHDTSHKQGRHLGWTASSRAPSKIGMRELHRIRGELHNLQKNPGSS